MLSFTNNRELKHPIALSFDVEDWFTVRNMRDFISDDQWDEQEQRVDVGMNFILDALKEKNIKSTFFILGWVADRCPELVKRISDEGHEIACHGYQHTPVDLLTPEAFEADLRKAIKAIEAVTGQVPKGFRAPSFSITKKTAWAIPILKNCGIEYDSSIFTTTHPDYGVQDFPTKVTSTHDLVEVPLVRSTLFGAKVPVCGGGYFRMLPYSFTKAALDQDLKTSPMVMYFHPWEFDPEQPQMDLPMVKSFRHYVGLKKNREKFMSLLNDYSFITMEQLVANTKAMGPLPEYRFQSLEKTPNGLLLPQFAN